MRLWVGTNWKIIKTLAEATDFAKRLLGWTHPPARPALRNPLLHGLVGLPVGV